MKSVVFAAIVICLVIAAGCKKDDLSTDSERIVGRWRLSEMIINNSKIEKPNPYNGTHEVEIEFFENSRLKGTTSSNRIGGSYTFNGQDSIALFYGFETKMGEIDWGRHFCNASIDMKTYTLSADFLELRGMGSDRLIFRRVR